MDRFSTASGHTADASDPDCAELVRQYQERYCRLSDRELVWKYRESGGAERAACRALLEERGFELDGPDA